MGWFKGLLYFKLLIANACMPCLLVCEYSSQSERVFYTYIFTLCTFSYKQITKAIAQLKKGIKNIFQITFSSYGISNASMTVKWVQRLVSEQENYWYDIKLTKNKWHTV